MAGVNDVRVVAYTDKERAKAHALFVKAIKEGDADAEMLNDMAEMLLRATLPGEVGALSDS